jgi:hypothetical protein
VSFFSFEEAVAIDNGYKNDKEAIRKRKRLLESISMLKTPKKHYFTEL